MTIQVAVLCDAATDYNSKLNLLGTFDTILASQLPAHHPQCSVALRIAFDRAEEGSHHLAMNFVDEDGQPIMPAHECAGGNRFPRGRHFHVAQFRCEHPAVEIREGRPLLAMVTSVAWMDQALVPASRWPVKMMERKRDLADVTRRESPPIFHDAD